jgi:hypothetical protein
LVNISHAYSPAIDKLCKWELPVADTWESELSKNGNSYESWKRLLDEKKLGALAFIRNLRNIMQVWVSHKELEVYLRDIDMGKVFPFQLIQAVDMCVNQSGLNDKSDLYKALEKKIYSCFESFAALFEGKVAIGVDISWSMHHPINNKSSLERITMAGYYGMGLQHYGADLYVWWDQCYKADNFSVQDFRRFNQWTNINCLLSWVQGKGYDTLFVITDEQSRFGMMQSDVKNIIVWNIADYSHWILPSYDNWYTYVTGFNDAQFEIAKDLRDLPKLVASINAMSF